MQSILILSGPTAVGKTEASLTLAKRLNGEIINADSMQVYRGMNIGTAKLPEAEQDGIPHHLIDICDPTESFDVVRFQTEAKKCIDDITARGHLPILVGGTGFYIQAVLYDIDFTAEAPNPEIREKYDRFAAENGAQALHDKLREVDPDAADAIHANNIKRVIRALEYFETTGEPISAHNTLMREKDSPYRFLYAVLTLPRETLYERIDTRVDQMIAAGLVDEVKSLLEQGVTRDCTSMQGLGYKEIAAHLNGECSLEEAVRIIKRDTRHFAKRQLTWYSREKEVHFYAKDQYTNDLIDTIAEDFHLMAEE